MEPSKSLDSRLLLSLCKGADTPRSLTMWLLWKHGEIRQFVDMKIDPLHYLDARGRRELRLCDQSFVKDLCVTEFYSKRSDLVIPGVDRRKTAYENFIEGEKRNAETNQRFRSKSFDPEVLEIIESARHEIARLLCGHFPGLNIRGASRFGPGATAALRREDAKPWLKTLYTGDVTRSAERLAKYLFQGDPHRFAAVSGVMPWGEFSVLPNFFQGAWKPRLVMVDGTATPKFADGLPIGRWDYQPHEADRLVYVDKDALKDRTITAQAGVNLELQFALASGLRVCLRAWGIDLQDQGPNQAAAREAFTKEQPGSSSYDRTPCTLDLRNASNHNAYEMIRYFLSEHKWLPDPGYLPEQLLRFACLTRSTQFVSRKGPRKYEMFSAMGNGYTFELETLVFAALARASQRHCGLPPRSLAYGDDIIVMKGAAPVLMRVLDAVGHVINARKSYTSGLYYESCGSHYFEGEEVTPVFQKVDPGSSLQEIVRCHNRLARFAFRAAGRCAARDSEDVGPPCPVKGVVGRKQLLMAAWLRPSLRTLLNEGFDVSTADDKGVKRVPIQPLGRDLVDEQCLDWRIAYARVRGVRLDKTFFEGLAPLNTPRSALYDDDSGFAVGYRYIGAIRSYSVATRHFGFVTRGLKTVLREEPSVWFDQTAAYASTLRNGVTPVSSQSERTLVRPVIYRDGWADTIWVS